MDKENIDTRRRDFCKSSVLAAGGLMFSGLPLSATAYAAGSDVIKVAVVGCGGRGTGAAAQALSTKANVKVVALADAFQDRLDGCLEALTHKFADTPDKVDVPSEQKFVGFEAYKHAIDLADVAILTTPPGFRPMHFEYAVNAGKHVFLEKPVATDVVGIKKVLAAAEMAKKKKLNVVSGLQRRYQVNYNEVYNRIREGAVGDIVSGSVYWSNDGVWVRPREPNQTEMEYQMRNWYYFNWLCGDHILEQHVHNIDVANWFIGEYPIRAQGMGGREVRTGPEYGQIFDHHFVEFEYPGGAVIASQCRHQPGCLTRIEERFQGTKGSVYVRGNNEGWLKDRKGKSLYEHNGSEDPNPYQTEHDVLFDAIVNGKYVNNAEYTAMSTMSAIMGRMATYSGQMVTWDEAMNSDLDLLPKEFDWNANPPVMPNEKGLYPVPVPGQTKFF